MRCGGWVMGEIVAAILLLLGYFGSWALAFRSIRKRWPRGWEIFPH